MVGLKTTSNEMIVVILKINGTDNILKEWLITLSVSSSNAFVIDFPNLNLAGQM